MDKKGDIVKKVISFPMKVWCDFETEARNKYGDCYWLAIKDMKEKAAIFDSVNILRTDIETLYAKVQELEERLTSGPNALSEVEKQFTLGEQGLKE